MEAAGTGFDKIAQEYEKADEKHKPYIYSTSDHFTLVLPDLTYAEGVEGDDVVHVEFMPVSNGTEHDEKVLAFCYKHARKVGEIAKYLGLSNSSYLRDVILGNLEKQNYLEKVKINRSAGYKANPEMVRE